MFMLWAGILMAPVAFLLHLQINYSLVPWVCVTGKAFTLHIATVATLLLAGAGCVVAWRSWRDTAEGRGHFMAAWGMMMSALFFIAIIAQAIPVFILGPCQK